MCSQFREEVFDLHNEPIQVVREKIKAVMVEDSPYIRFRDVFFVRESIECVRVLESED